MLISIVVPVYNEEKNIREILERVRAVLERMSSEFEIIFAMDPSPDRTENVILEARAQDPCVKSSPRVMTAQKANLANGTSHAALSHRKYRSFRNAYRGFV